MRSIGRGRSRPSSRYYDPEVGRFINSDDVNVVGLSGTVVSYNIFAYCENNPVNGKDLSGYNKTRITPFDLAKLAKKFIESLKRVNSLEFFLKTEYGKSEFGHRNLKIKVIRNSIKITANFLVYGNLKYKKLDGDKYVTLFIEGIEKYWSGNFSVSGYNVRLTTVAKSRLYGIRVNMLNQRGVSNVAYERDGWAIGKYGRVTMYRGDSRGDSNGTIRDYEKEEFMWVSAHEFGHLLGVKDITSVKSIFNEFRTEVQDIDLNLVMLAFIYNKTMGG